MAEHFSLFEFFWYGWNWVAVIIVAAFLSGGIASAINSLTSELHAVRVALEKAAIQQRGRTVEPPPPADE